MGRICRGVHDAHGRFRRSQDSDSRVDAVLNSQDRDYEE
jgi:hypothetical protein